MSFSLLYIIHRFFFRLSDFFHHWYIDASRYLVHGHVTLLEHLDRFFAVRVTWKYLFEPLWKDYTAIGRVMGFLFRSGRIATGVGAYLALTILFIVSYLVWLAFPFAVLGMAFWTFNQKIPQL